MPVYVEFFGIPRERAGVATLEIDARDLSAALDSLSRALPRFAEDCVRDGRLRSGYVANLNGQTFSTDPRLPLRDGDSLLILSADAGG